jgi:Cft2 family RNA processing exonuclease
VYEFRFLPLGGTQVGASCYLYELGGTRLLIDCGVQPGLLGAEGLPRLELLKDHQPDALVITHAHSDHIGALAVVKLLFPDLPVYMTEATARITLPMLLDAARVAQRNGSPMFNETDVVKALQGVSTFTPNVPFEIGEVTLTPRVGGHIVGAVGLMLEHTSGFRIWHTADFNTVATPTTDAAYLPPVPEEVDVVVTETTYGNLELPSRKKQNGDFIAQVRKVLGEGGRVLVPTFALGRAQDVLLTLTRQLPGTRVYLDGLTREITRLFASMPKHLPEGVRNQLKNGTNPFLGPQVTLVEDRKEREYVIHNPEPAVILASSGMLSQGVSPLYAKHVLQEPKSAVLIVGYQDAESAGRRLLEGRDELMLNGEAITVSSHIERFYLSAHADRLGISQHLSRYPSERLVLTHGEGGAREAIFDLFHKERHVDRPRVGEWVDLAGETRVRRKLAPLPAAKRGATRIKRYKAEVKITHKGNQLIVELPENFDMTLVPAGNYRLEAQLAAIASFKLVERPDGVPDTNEVEGASAEAEDQEALV